MLTIQTRLKREVSGSPPRDTAVKRAETQDEQHHDREVKSPGFLGMLRERRSSPGIIDRLRERRSSSLSSSMLNAVQDALHRVGSALSPGSHHAADVDMDLSDEDVSAPNSMNDEQADETTGHEMRLGVQVEGGFPWGQHFGAPRQEMPVPSTTQSTPDATPPSDEEFYATDTKNAKLVGDHLAPPPSLTAAASDETGSEAEPKNDTREHHIADRGIEHLSFPVDALLAKLAWYDPNCKTTTRPNLYTTTTSTTVLSPFGGVPYSITTRYYTPLMGFFTTGVREISVEGWKFASKLASAAEAKVLEQHGVGVRPHPISGSPVFVNLYPNRRDGQDLFDVDVNGLRSQISPWDVTKLKARVHTSEAAATDEAYNPSRAKISL